MSKEFWTSKDAGCLGNGEITYDNASRIETKRPHQWFTDGGEEEFFPNKKQALGVSSSNSFVQVPAPNLSSWGNMSSFDSVPSQVTERFFDAETTRSINFIGRNIPSVNDGNLNMGRKGMNDLFGRNSSFGSYMSQSLEDPKSSLNYNGIRKVKVSEVRDYEIPIAVGSSFSSADNNVISKAHDYGKLDDSDRSLGLRYGQEGSVITAGATYIREDDIFMSMRQSFNKVDSGIMAMGHNYSFKADNNIDIANSIAKSNVSILSMTENFNEGDSDVISMANFSKGDDNIIAMNQTYRGDDSSITVCNNYNQGDESTTSTAQLNHGGDNSLSMGHSFDKGESNMISFGGYNNEEEATVSGGLICSYDLLMSQPSVSKLDTLNHKLVMSDANALLNSVQVLTSGAERSSKKKEDQKSTNKTPSNNFPSNVRSLLSTGILDEIPVKYIAWSREKELRGVIKGTGYLCGCQSCNFSKVINAYEFERHASCKTKHPNNHIYFENGKTIYGIVQELRSTPQNLLFDVIQTITGSPINQKSFRLWKESFLAATRELQRIYGKDERNQLV